MGDESSDEEPVLNDVNMGGGVLSPSPPLALADDVLQEMVNDHPSPVPSPLEIFSGLDMPTFNMQQTGDIDILNGSIGGVDIGYMRNGPTGNIPQDSNYSTTGGINAIGHILTDISGGLSADDQQMPILEHTLPQDYSASGNTRSRDLANVENGMIGSSGNFSSNHVPVAGEEEKALLRRIKGNMSSRKSKAKAKESIREMEKAVHFFEEENPRMKRKVEAVENLADSNERQVLYLRTCIKSFSVNNGDANTLTADDNSSN